MVRFLLILSLPVLLLLLFACPGGKETEIGSDLRESLTSFDTARQETAVQVSESVSAINEAFAFGSDSDPAGGIAKIWIAKWELVVEAFDELTQRFNDVKERGEEHFENVGREVETINDDGLRREKARQVEAMRAKWDGQVTSTAAVLGQLKGSIEDGMDLWRAMRVNIYLAEVSDDIENLKDIEQQARILFAKLESLTEEGMQLIYG